jgi:hypothetical protein
MLSSLPRQKQGNAPARITGGISLFSAWRKQAPGEGEEGNAKHSFVTPPGDSVRYGECFNAQRINDRPSIRNRLHDRSGSLVANAYPIPACGPRRTRLPVRRGTWPRSWHPTYP